ncbi:hypothetical protein [Halobacteriaceae bacterium SHR40]|uniref:hypothetical protein n=1 Tax=Halovenus amylolytica TaxID=2500550 RepID=UPI000FE33BFA
MPREVLNSVGYDHEVHGPSIHWNYERNGDYIILSNYPLRESNYVDIERTKIYDIDTIDNGPGRIRIPGSMDDKVKSHFFEGTRVNYMAYTEMLEQDNPAVFVLSNPQLQQLLPREASEVITESDGSDDLDQSVFELPAFLPSP